MINFNEYITGIYEILNVWANDANKLSVFINGLFLPYIILIIFSTFRETFNRRYFKTFFLFKFNVEIMFLFIFLSFIVSAAGIGQLIIPPIYDAAARSVGLILLISGSILRFVYYKLRSIDKEIFRNKSTNLFYKYIRYPEYTFLIMISYGICISFLNIAGILLSTLFLIPYILARIVREEKYMIEKDESYIDYKFEVPMILPDIRKIITKKIIDKIND